MTATVRLDLPLQTMLPRLAVSFWLPRGSRGDRQGFQANASRPDGQDQFCESETAAAVHLYGRCANLYNTHVDVEPMFQLRIWLPGAPVAKCVSH